MGTPRAGGGKGLWAKPGSRGTWAKPGPQGGMVEYHPPGREAQGEDHFNDEVDKGWEETDALTELPPRGAAGRPREGGQ